MTATTYGSEIAEFAARAGLKLSTEDVALLEAICSIGDDGKWTKPKYFVPFGSDVLEARALAGLFLFGEQSIVWVGARAGEVNGSFRRLARLVEANPELRQEVAKIRYANGEARIELKAGSRLLCPGGALGARGVSADLLLTDGKLSDRDEMSVVPVLVAAPNPQRIVRL